MKKSFHIVWAERAEKDLLAIVGHIARDHPSNDLKHSITENKKGHFASLSLSRPWSAHSRATRTGCVAIQRTDHNSMAGHV